MRACQICSNPERKLIEKDYHHTSIVNAGVTAPLSRFECTKCGHHYLDGDSVDQAWFDNYYLTRYKTDDKPFSDARLVSLADLVAENCQRVLDIGGQDGELRARLSVRGVICDIAGVGDIATQKYHGVILSHTLEHIYDVSAMMRRIQAALTEGELLFIEVPIHLDYKDLKKDMHWQHINKFKPIDLEGLLKNNNFGIADSCQLPDYREYQVWRIVGKNEIS